MTDIDNKDYTFVYKYNEHYDIGVHKSRNDIYKAIVDIFVDNDNVITILSPADVDIAKGLLYNFVIDTFETLHPEFFHHLFDKYKDRLQEYFEPEAQKCGGNNASKC